MQLKKARFKSSYVSDLEVITKDFADQVEVIIRVNGIGVPRDKIKHLFKSFMTGAICNWVITTAEA